MKSRHAGYRVDRSLRRPRIDPVGDREEGAGRQTSSLIYSFNRQVRRHPLQISSSDVYAIRSCRPTLLCRRNTAQEPLIFVFITSRCDVTSWGKEDGITSSPYPTDSAAVIPPFWMEPSGSHYSLPLPVFNCFLAFLSTSFLFPPYPSGVSLLFLSHALFWRNFTLLSLKIENGTGIREEFFKRYPTIGNGCLVILFIKQNKNFFF